MHIDFYAILVWVHVLLLVYWLGADLGVLIAAIWFKNKDFSLVERTLLLKITAAIDLMPRMAFALMLPVGFTLAATRWNLPVPAMALPLFWVFALVWIAGIAVAFRHHDRPIAALIGRIQFYVLGIGGAVLIAYGVSMMGGNAVIPAWLAWKIVLYGAIFFLAIGIDLGFRPVMPAFMRLATEGSSPEIESRISGAVNRTIMVVLTLYAVVLVISFLGVTKPGF